MCVSVPHLYRYVQHEAWLPRVGHAHDSDPISVTHTHFLSIHTHTHINTQSKTVPGNIVKIIKNNDYQTM